MRLIAPFARITMGDSQDVWETAPDGILQSVNVQLSEGKRDNSCSFVLSDKGMAIAAKYFATSFAQGGIKVSRDLLQDEQPVATGDSASGSNYDTTGTGPTSIGSLTENQYAMLSAISFCEGTDKPNGYSTKYGGGTFNPASGHPGGGAAGKYQFLPGTWRSVAGGAMTPAKQDAAALKLIAGRGAMSAVQAGRWSDAFKLLRNEWTSLPGAAEQSSHTYQEVLARIDRAKRDYRAKRGGTGTSASSSSSNEVAGSTNADATSTTPAEPPVQDHRGTSIKVELGFGGQGKPVSFQFIHTSSQATGPSPATLELGGNSVKCLLGRRSKSSSFCNITLQQLAEMFCKNYGLTLEFHGGPGPKYGYLDQTGISDLSLLYRECMAHGYVIQSVGQGDKSTTLKISPVFANFSGLVLTQDMVSEMTFTDKASVEANNASGPGWQSTSSQPASSSGDRKTSIDPLTGKMRQDKKENTKATGAQGTSIATGATKIPVSGTAEIAIPRVYGEEITGLPNVPSASVAVTQNKDGGTITAQTFIDEARRVSQWPSTAKCKTTPELLLLVPGNTIGISRELVPDEFSREWRIDRITHDWSPSGCWTELEFSSPQKQRPPQATGSVVTDGGSSVDTSNVPNLQGWCHPCPIGNASGAGGQWHATRKYGQHDGQDIGGAGRTNIPIYAVNSGTVTASSNTGDGYGNRIEILHADGTKTTYSHLASRAVNAGDNVQSGQKIGVMGQTGGGVPIHLHFEAIVNGQKVNPNQYMKARGITLSKG